MKIVVAEIFGLESDQKERLEKLGDTVFYAEPAKDKKEKFNRLKDADVICGETEPVMEVIYDLTDKMISFPFVGVGFMDLEKLAKNNVKVSNAPGCNKEAVSEWVVSMMLNLGRKFKKYIDIKELKDSDVMEDIPGLAGKNVTILGKGNIGSRVGKLCEVFNMNVTYFDKSDDLINSAKDADYVVNSLQRNDSTEGLLNKDFFESLKQGAYFMSITDTDIYDIDTLVSLLDSGKIAGAAIDPAGASIFDANDDFYKKIVKHPKILATPHIAFHNAMTIRKANDIMIDNVEAWVKKKPQNIVN